MTKKDKRTTSATWMKLIGIFPLLLLLSDASIAAENKQNEGSVGWTLDVYDKKLTAEDRRNIASFINGMQIGLMWGNVMLKDRHQPQLYCQPGRLTITNEQMVDMLRQMTKEDPRTNALPLGLGVLETLRRTFPCKL